MSKKPYKIKTIKLSQGEYAPVDERLRLFHEENPQCSIQCQVNFIDGQIAQAIATVIPNIDMPTRIFTGSSYGKIGAVKAYEKLETIAVGRALAFAGYLADGKIASYEEMQKFEEENGFENQKPVVKKTEEKPKLTPNETIEKLNLWLKSGVPETIKKAEDYIQKNNLQSYFNQ